MSFVSFDLHIIILAVLGTLLVRWLVFNRHSYPFLAKFLTTEKDRLSYAYHEAGHALALLKLDCGHELKQITLSPTIQSGFLGLPFYSASHVKSENIEDALTLEQAYNWLICELSGEAAENILHNTPGKSRLSAAHDKKTARKIAQHIAKHQKEEVTIRQLITKASHDAHVFVEENQSTLKLIAKTLEAQKTLSANKAKAMV